MVWFMVPFLILGTDLFWYNCSIASAAWGQAMKDDTLWFATSIAWTLVLLGATFFAIFA
jgi:hypothetical protein